MYDIPIAIARPQQLPGNAEAVAADLPSTHRAYRIYYGWLLQYRKHRKASPFPVDFVRLTEATDRALTQLALSAYDSTQSVVGLYAARVVVSRVLLLAEIVRAPRPAPAPPPLPPEQLEAVAQARASYLDNTPTPSSCGVDAEGYCANCDVHYSAESSHGQ